MTGAAGTILMEGTVWSMVLGGAVGAFSGFGVPGLIRRVPEPTPEPAETSDSDIGAESTVLTKPLYAGIAGLPGLGLSCSAVATVVGVLIGWRLGLGWPLVAWLVFLPLALALGLIDARTRLLPSYLIKPGYVVLVPLILLPSLVSQDWTSLKRTAMSWAIYGGVFFLLWLIHPRGMGYGDVRLSGLIGLLVGVVGWAELIVTFYATFLLGPILMLALTGFAVRRKQVPFGPFMLLGALVGLTCGRWVLTTLVF